MKSGWFVRGDIDGFFGLFVDNLLQLMLIVAFCSNPHICNFPPELIVGRILPGAAVSLLVGNLFYAWQARRLMARTGRTDVTALPYGINTVSLIAFVLLIMAPVYAQTKDPILAWRAGLFATLLCGLMEVAGAFVADWFRRHTPRAALLSALAGIAITFIAMGFVFQIFAAPLIALLPMFLVLLAYGGKARFPLGLPGGLVAVLVGVAVAWVLHALGLSYFQPLPLHYTPALRLPVPVFGDAIALFLSPLGWKYLAVILPMGLFNIIGSLQNLESAAAAGDHFDTMPSLLVNGLGSIVAACFGSAFPTTIYIGHPGWKAMGARAGYSILNGVAITLLVLLGGVTLVLQIVPVEAALGILLWIGIIITAQAFQAVPKPHALAVAVGLLPALAAWALLLINTALRAAGTNLYAVADHFGSDLYIHGVIALSQGFILTSMILSALVVYIVERRFVLAGIWALVGSVFSCLGLIHAYRLTPDGVQDLYGLLAAPEFALMYAITGVLLIGLGMRTPQIQGGLAK